MRFQVPVFSFEKQALFLICVLSLIVWGLGPRRSTVPLNRNRVWDDGSLWFVQSSQPHPCSYRAAHAAHATSAARATNAAGLFEGVLRCSNAWRQENQSNATLGNGPV